jgi:hypothetical protein
MWLWLGLKSDVMALWLCQLVTTVQSCLQNKIHEEKTLTCRGGREDVGEVGNMILYVL